MVSYDLWLATQKILTSTHIIKHSLVGTNIIKHSLVGTQIIKHRLVCFVAEIVGMEGWWCYDTKIIKQAFALIVIFLHKKQSDNTCMRQLVKELEF